MSPLRRFTRLHLDLRKTIEIQSFILICQDSKEIWLIQWPINQPSDFYGQRMSLKLDGDGHLGSFEGCSGKSYAMFSLKSRGPEAFVFLSSASEAKLAGKISRNVSLVHYPESSEYKKRNDRNFSRCQRSSAAISTASVSHMVSHHSSRGGQHSQAVSGYSTPSSRNKSSVASAYGDPSKSRKRRQEHEQTGSISSSSQDSGRGKNSVTTTEHSEERKSKKTKTTN